MLFLWRTNTSWIPSVPPKQKDMCQDCREQEEMAGGLHKCWPNLHHDSEAGACVQNSLEGSCWDLGNMSLMRTFTYVNENIFQVTFLCCQEHMLNNWLPKP